MARVYLGLGTNLGNKTQNLMLAMELIAHRIGKIVAYSDNYVSEPWGFHSENDFLNNVLEVDTSWSPMELLNLTQTIEKELGRTAKSVTGYADRLIDIDILLYDHLIVDLPELKIPHPLIMERDFVFIPLGQIAPKLSHPVTGQLFGNLLKR